MTDLFTPITLGRQQLPNRIFMAPMTRNRAPEGIPTALMQTYYTQRADAGLLITEGAQVSEQGVGYPATPGIYSEAQVTGWKQVTDSVHAHDGHIFCQLWHCGRVSHPDFHNGELPIAPSAIRPDGQAFTYEGLKDFVTPRALDIDEIPGIVEQYRHAASRADQAGFDGVEIHAANGYLIDQFLRDGSNQRSDQYGGSIENRARLLMEVVAACSDAIGADRVGVRLSPINSFNDIHDSDPRALFEQVASQLSGKELAYLHVVEVDMAGQQTGEVDMRRIRDNFAGTYIANGGYDKLRANAAIAAGAADAVAFGVPYLANPDLVTRLKNDAPLNEADMDTFYGGDEHGYTDYPTLDEA